jgi:hypothetical protein
MALVTTMSMPVATTSAVLALGKRAWRIVDSLPILKGDIDILGLTVDDLAAEIKSLALKCESAYITLEEKVEKGETAHLTQAVDGGLWDCLAMQVNEASRTLQDLELFIQSVRGEEARCIGLGQLDEDREKIAITKTRVVRHIDDLYFTLLLIKM